MSNRPIVEQALRDLLTGYREGPFSNDQLVDMALGAINARGGFKPDPREPTPSAPALERRLTLKNICIALDEEDNCVDLWCTACEERVVEESVAGWSLNEIVDACRDHWRSCHT